MTPCDVRCPAKGGLYSVAYLMLRNYSIEGWDQLEFLSLYTFFFFILIFSFFFIYFFSIWKTPLLATALTIKLLGSFEPRLEIQYSFWSSSRRVEKKKRKMMPKKMNENKNNIFYQLLGTRRPWKVRKYKIYLSLLCTL